MSTIAVTGASGFVGRYVCRELLARGHSVRALIRDGTKAREVFGTPAPERLHYTTGDCCDPSALGQLLQGCDAAIHLVGIIREVRGEDADKPQSFYRMHVQATQAIVDACQTAKVGRYLHMSALGIGPEGRAKYQQTKWEAEQVVRRSGLDWTVFRPSLVHGPDGEFIKLFKDLCSGEVPPYLFIPYFAKGRVDHSVIMGAITFEPAMVQPVAVEDVAIAFAQAISNPDTFGEIYNLVGPEKLDWRELSEFLRDTLPGAKRSMGTWYIPGEHAALIATAAQSVGLGSLLPFDPGQALMALEDNTGELFKMQHDLNLTPRSFRAGVKAYAQTMAAH